MYVYKEGEPMSQETRIALLEQSIENISQTLIRFESRFDKIDRAILDNKKELLEEIAKIDSKVDSNFKYIITTMITLFILSSLMPVVSHILSKYVG